MSSTKEKQAELDVLEMRIMTLVDKPMSCAEVTRETGSNGYTVAHMLRRLVRSETLMSFTTGEKDRGCNVIAFYAPAGYVGSHEPAPTRQRGQNQINVARDAITRSGKTEGIDSSWLASVTGLTVAQSSDVLKSMVDKSMAELEGQVVMFGRRRNFYRVTDSINSTPELRRNDAYDASLNVAHHMALFVIPSGKRFDLRGTA